MSAITATASGRSTTKKHKALHAPMVAFKRHPLRWTRYTIQTRGYGLLLAHVGLFAVAGFYYLLLQQKYNFSIGPVHIYVWLKHWWDHLGNGLFGVTEWTALRHTVRNVGEGLYGSMLFLLVCMDVWKAQSKLKDEPPRLARVAMFFHFPSYYRKVTGWQIALLPLTILIAAVPFFAIGYGVVLGLHALFHVHTLAPVLAHHPTFAARLYASGLDAKVVGVFAGLGGKMPAKPVFSFIQHYFAHRRVAKGKRDRFWQPVAFRALVRETTEKFSAEQASEKVAGRGNWIPAVIGLATVIILAFGYEGYHIISLHG